MEIGMPDGALENRVAGYLEAWSNEVLVTVLIAPIRPSRRSDLMQDEGEN